MTHALGVIHQRLRCPKFKAMLEKAKLGVKMSTYNLEWWKRGSGAPSFVMQSWSKQVPYDVLGFQECENPWQRLWQPGWQSDYQAIHAAHGRDVQICVAYRNSTWKSLSSGGAWVSQDQ